MINYWFPINDDKDSTVHIQTRLKKKAMIFITYHGLRFSSAGTKNLLTEIYKGGFGSLPKYNLEILEKAKYKD